MGTAALLGRAWGMYILTELRVGYRMPKGEQPAQEAEPPAAP